MEAETARLGCFDQYLLQAGLVYHQTIAKPIDFVLAWYDHPISTAPQEGLNNKIKALKRMAYGFCDMEFFQFRILFIHKAQSKMSCV